MKNRLNNNEKAFFALVKAGLWEQDVKLSTCVGIAFSEIRRLAEEQSVVGLVSAGLEHVVDVKIPKEEALQFVGQALQLEQQNNAMNHFIGVIVDKMRRAGIYTLLVKGQGIARCYERPLWRACGDVDFYLSESNYNAARGFLKPLASHVEDEDCKRLHLGMTIDQWTVELHGTLHSDFSNRMNKGLDDVHRSIFDSGDVRSWNNDGVSVYMPSADNDVIIVFTHFLQHFFIGGIGLRQICDWSRLLWTYRDQIDRKMLDDRLKAMRLISEWKAFSAFAVEYLDMPRKAMPLYDDSKKWHKKASFLKGLILEAGNLGINNESYRFSQSERVSKMTVFRQRLKEFSRLTLLFPWDAPVFFVTYLVNRLLNMRG